MLRPVNGRVLFRLWIGPRRRLVIWWESWPPRGVPPPKPVNYSERSFWRDYFKFKKSGG